MTDETANALAIIKKACAAVVADLANHQAIQGAIATVETALTARVPQIPIQPAKPAQNGK